jgi:hypothetical protein
LRAVDDRTMGMTEPAQSPPRYHLIHRIWYRSGCPGEAWSQGVAESSRPKNRPAGAQRPVRPAESRCVTDQKTPPRPGRPGESEPGGNSRWMYRLPRSFEGLEGVSIKHRFLFPRQKIIHSSNLGLNHMTAFRVSGYGRHHFENGQAVGLKHVTQINARKNCANNPV